MSKAQISTDKHFLFWCPGCTEHHGFPVDGSRGWQWNGSLESPTITPSILVSGVVRLTSEEHAILMSGGLVEPVKRVCHSYIKDGQIQFLNDCTHALAGQTVDLPEFES